MFRLIDDFPFCWVTTSRNISCKYNLLIAIGKRWLAFNSVVCVKNLWIDINRATYHILPLFLLFNAVLVIKHRTNTIKSLKLIQSMFNQKAFGTVPSTKSVEYLLLCELRKRGLELITVLGIDMGV